MLSRLIVFTRFPRTGQVKSRLIPALGAAGAAAVHTALTRHTLAWVAELAAADAIEIEVRFDGGDAGGMRALFGDWNYIEQGPGDLGDRLARAVGAAFDAGRQRVVLVGTDCPGLTAELAASARDALDRHDLVLGPATDGGYYLVGLRRPDLDLFSGIGWGGDRVLADTLAAADRLGLNHALLPHLPDVDRPEDLVHWRRIEQPPPVPHPDRISVVVPVRNEAAHLPAALSAMQDAVDVETIVVDGGSQDDSLEVARRAGCLAFSTAAGRAMQMNAGAAAATGAVLLFLHADTRLPHGFDRIVRAALADTRIAIGAFRLRFDRRGAVLDAIARAANWRARWLKLPYGDQALFCRTTAFWRVGGFPDWPLLEDVALVGRLRRVGRLAIAPADAITSARRYAAAGPWRTVLRNQAVLAGYWCGVAPPVLATWRRRGAPPSRPSE
jgi:uncharacterized protein